MKAIKIDTNRNMTVADIPAPLYDGLGELLDGTPEHVRPKRLPPPYCMMVDDCGLVKYLPENPLPAVTFTRRTSTAAPLRATSTS